jgi:hypothetical protein
MRYVVITAALFDVCMLLDGDFFCDTAWIISVGALLMALKISEEEIIGYLFLGRAC